MTALPEAPKYLRDREIGGRADLANNISPNPPAALALAALRNTAGILNQYPDPTYTELITAVADRLHVPHSTVMVGAGSSSILRRLIGQACQEPGDQAMWAEPAFDAFATFARQVGARPQRIPAAADGSTDLDAMLAAITSTTRIIIVVNPHNPTGVAVSGDRLRGFLAHVPDEVVVVIDEAYRDFCRDSLVAKGAELVKARWADGHDNVVLVRTFSKAYGLAGLRVGYGIAAPTLAAAIWEAGVPREITIPSAAAAVAALKSSPAMEENVARITAERRRVLGELRRLGFAPPESEANFLWLPLAEDSAEFMEHCLRFGVEVRTFAERGVRVSIGHQTHNDNLLRAAFAWVTRGAP